jgi:diguanylate cyclase (GGDEF)-like protein
MKKQMIQLIKTSLKNKKAFDTLQNIYDLYDQLQYAENIQEMASNLYDWLNEKYNINQLNFYLFDMSNNKNTSILIVGEEFALDDKLAFYFIINTHTQINAIVSFKASNKTDYNIVSNDYNFIEAAFFQISPILQNGIMKKYHIESSSLDSVTNVYDRKYLIEKIKKIISLSDNQDKNITFLLIGIDHFKAIIEEFDYDIADKVLIELAKVIHSNIKDFDIVARLTGDEFLIALINLPHPSEATKIAEKIIKQFALVKVVVNEKTKQTLQKTICIGISTYPQDGKKINDVLKNADRFLNEAKNKGRGQFAVFTKEQLSTIDLF